MDTENFTTVGALINNLKYTAFTKPALVNISHLNLLSFNSTIKNNTQLQIEVPSYTIMISLVMYTLIFVIGFFGNALVIIVAYFNHTHHHNLGTTNYCLVNLSVADLLLILVCLPSAILDLFSQEIWYLGNFLCKNFLNCLKPVLTLKTQK